MGKMRIEASGKTVDADVCIGCGEILADPGVVGIKETAKKTGTGGAKVNIRPGKMVGRPVICLYVPPTKEVKQ